VYVRRILIKLAQDVKVTYAMNCATGIYTGRHIFLRLALGTLYNQ
jgi:hypothetical protein